jgi:hypothetical protein
MTESIESIGQGETSFVESGIRFPLSLKTDKLVSTNSCVAARLARVSYQEWKMHLLDKPDSKPGLGEHCGLIARWCSRVRLRGSASG